MPELCSRASGFSLFNCRVLVTVADDEPAQTRVKRGPSHPFLEWLGVVHGDWAVLQPQRPRSVLSRELSYPLTI